MTPDPDTVTAEEPLAHGRWVQALARSLAADASTADDVAQEAWVDALEHPPRRRGNLRAWFARIVRRRWADHVRAEVRRARPHPRAASGDAAPTADEVLVRAETRLRIARELLALEEPYRGTLLLRFHEELPPRRIARHQGIPVATVRTRLQRGLARLRARLGADDRQDSRRALLLVAGL